MKFNTIPRPSSATSSHLQSAAFGYCAGKSGDVISPPSLADPVLDKSILRGDPAHGSPSSGTLNVTVFIKSNAPKSSFISTSNKISWPTFLARFYSMTTFSNVSLERSSFCGAG